MTGAVRLITEAKHANEIVTGGNADCRVACAGAAPAAVPALKAQQELGAVPTWPISYGYAVKAAVQVTHNLGNALGLRAVRCRSFWRSLARCQNLPIACMQSAPRDRARQKRRRASAS